jgi:DNA-binding CsgD family transcriptional regulator
VALGRDVGLVETPALGLSDDGTAPLWDALVVWLALGVERCLDAQSGHTRPGPRNPSARLAAQYGLTPREASVVKLCAEGRTNKEIALTLGLTERTVETHLSNVFRKTGVPNRASLVSAYFTTAGGPRRA